MTTNAPTPCRTCAARGVNRAADLGICCTKCRNRADEWLTDILEFYALSTGELMPGSGTGGRGCETSIGLRVSALDFVSGGDILPRLWFWERDWRDERGFSHGPDTARMDGGTHVTATLAGVVNFLRTHLTWAYSEHPAADEFHGDLSMLRAQASVAARVASPKVHVITCPTDVLGDDGEASRCGRRLLISGDVELDAYIRCDTCTATWTVKRLLTVVASDTESEVWVAEDDASLLYGVAGRTLRKWAALSEVRRERGMYELGSVREAVATAIADGRLTGA